MRRTQTLPRGGKRAALAASFGALMFGALQVAGATESSNLDPLARTLQEMRRATSAEVYFVPNHISTTTSLGKDEIPKNGCGYRVASHQLGDLLALIERASIAARSERELLSMRMLIRLHTPGGVLIEIAFESRPSFGAERLSGQVNGLDASAAAGFFAELERWASASGLTVIRRISGSCP